MIGVLLAVSYIPADIADGTRIAELDTGPGGIYARLAKGSGDASSTRQCNRRSTNAGAPPSSACARQLSGH